MTALQRQISIQPANEPDGSYNAHKQLPYPYHIGQNGEVGRQDFWKGEPVRLLGFQNVSNVHLVDIHSFEFWDDPEIAVGKYPVFVDADGGIWNDVYPVLDVTVHGVTEDGEDLS